MDILYHIGLPKAMSTWLQKELFVEQMGYYSVSGNLLMDVIQYKNVHSRKYSRETLLLDLHAAKERNLTAVCSREGISITLTRTKTNFRQRAQMIHQLGLDAKVLLILREPKRWLYSVYQEQVRVLRTSVSLSRFLSSRHKIGNVDHEVGEVGYDELIEVYYGLFGKDKVLILLYELFLQDPTLYITRILQFSGIDHIEDKVKRLPIHKKVHSSSSPFRVQSYRALTYFLFQRGHLYPRLKRKTIKRQGSTINWLDTHVIPASYNMWLKQRWQHDIAMWVGDKYKSSNARASQLIGIDLAQYGYDM